MNEQLCTFKVPEPKSVRATQPCGHTEKRHALDISGVVPVHYCVPCWGSDDDELAHHKFTTAAAVPA